MSFEERLKYYLGDLYNQEKVQIIEPYLDLINNKNKKVNPVGKISKLTYHFIKHVNIPPTYSLKLFSLLRKCGHTEKPFLYFVGDNYKELNNYCITKNRSNQNKKMILLKCPNQNRHWEFVYNKSSFYDISFERKFNQVVWRGVTTGTPSQPGSRFTLVKKYYMKNPKINVGFNKIVQNKDEYRKYLIYSMSITEMLRYKYILAVEGNDKASGLNWMLTSNSIVFMAKPTKFSWLMEDKLKPNVHYVLVKDDFSDLLHKIKWCDAHPNKCKEINRNAKQYMKKFMDQNNELKLELAVLNHYFKKVKF